MAFKTVVQMFGDNAGNGAAVPYSTSNPPGTAAANRGVQFGEQLTSAIANRPHVALCLNDEDLNARLVSWETGGLDAAYRLGAVNTAGGGRLIQVNAGAVELRTALATQFAGDVNNAALRVDMSADTANGSTGFEAVADADALPLSFFTARAGQNLSAYNLSDPNAAYLNLSGGGADRIYPQGAGVSLAAIYAGIDSIEITASTGPNYVGVYRVFAVVNSGTPYLVLRKPDGSTPTFAIDTTAYFRVWRSTLQVTARPRIVGNPAFLGGITMAGMLTYNDTPVLNIFTEADQPYTTNNLGSRYALQVMDKNQQKRLRINSCGTVQTVTSAGMPSDGGVYGYEVGHYHIGSTGVAFGAIGAGAVGSGPADNTSAGCYSLLGLTYRSSGTMSTCSGSTVNLTGFSPCAGAAFYIAPTVTTGSKAGVYFVADASSGASTTGMQDINGYDANFAAGSCLVQALVGITVGSRYAAGGTPLAYSTSLSATATPPIGYASAARIQAPILNGGFGASCLALLNTNTDSPDSTIYMRCAAPAAGGACVDDFLVAAGGHVALRGTLRAANILATAGLRVPIDVTIPGPASIKYRNFTVSPLSALRESVGATWTINGTYNAVSLTNLGALVYDITSGMSHTQGDIILSFAVKPGAARGSTSNRVWLTVVAKNVVTGSTTALTDGYTASSAVWDDGTTNAQSLQFLLANYTMDLQTTRLFAVIRSGSDGASLQDQSYGGVISQYGQDTPYQKAPHN